MVLRIMTPYYFLGQDSNYPPIDNSTGGLNFFPPENYKHNFTFGPVVDVRKDHGSHIRKLGAAATVLLKNTKNTLPLKEPKNIGVFGNDAADYNFTQGPYPSNTDIGTLPVGGGSGTGRLTYVVSPLEAIKARAKSYGGVVQSITSNSQITNGGLNNISPKPDVCVVFLKSWASEGGDRRTLVAEWDSTNVVQKVAAFCLSTVVVLHGASPNVLPWKDHANVTAILAAHMPGQETGNSIVDVLWGAINPSGKLPYTIANQESDYSKNLVTNPGSSGPDGWQTDFSEGNLIDYKEFDAAKKNPAYEFGFGLSYTTFELSDIHINVLKSGVPRVPSASAKIEPGGNVELWETLVKVTATVKNTGGVSGATVPQLYLSLPSEAGAGTPVRSLRGFEKVQLAAGESVTVTFSLLRRDLSFWDTAAQTWRLPGGAIGVDVGFSSRDLKLKGSITV